MHVKTKLKKVIIVRVAINKFNQYDGKNLVELILRLLISSPASILLLGYAMLVIIMLSLLFFYHTFLISIGLTTFQHQKGFPIKKEGFIKSCIGNFLRVFCYRIPKSDIKFEEFRNN
jgi:hypothetical protein